jgi:hypothetical protein
MESDGGDACEGRKSMSEEGVDLLEAETMSLVPLWHHSEQAPSRHQSIHCELGSSI